ncbi:hypothetical protein BDN71DRAFT_1429190 [Pleurotus eryngii]|uniref:Uncharacterized protein n=1 Tax=Pleurotus eryngii TaxID=5323 RepID=A0A9P6D9F0_PLEER|nr:hypothetical protein BDN71DRAFT_1429190 [Pleurotus eryngii]
MPAQGYYPLHIPHNIAIGVYNSAIAAFDNKFQQGDAIYIMDASVNTEGKVSASVYVFRGGILRATVTFDDDDAQRRRDYADYNGQLSSPTNLRRMKASVAQASIRQSWLLERKSGKLGEHRDVSGHENLQEKECEQGKGSTERKRSRHDGTTARQKRERETEERADSTYLRHAARDLGFARFGLVDTARAPERREPRTEMKRGRCVKMDTKERQTTVDTYLRHAACGGIWPGVGAETGYGRERVYGQVVTKSGPADIAQTAGSTPPTCPQYEKLASLGQHLPATRGRRRLINMDALSIQDES